MTYGNSHDFCRALPAHHLCVQWGGRMCEGPRQVFVIGAVRMPSRAFLQG